MTNEEFTQSIALEGEEWRDVVGWERYAVSSFGRIVSSGAPYMQGGIPHYRKPQLITCHLNNSKPPYYRVRLSNGLGYRKTFAVHRLVATAFIPNPDNLPYVNHKDENSLNNNVSNLEWCTQQYNCNYGTHNQRMAQTISETAYQRRAVVQLALDNTFIAQFNCIKDAALAANVSRSSVSLCCRKLKPFLCGYKWMYLSDYESLINKSKNSLPVPITSD